MLTVSATLTFKISRKDCQHPDPKALDRWLRRIVEEAHNSLCGRFNGYGFTVDTEALRIIIPGG